MVPGAVIAIVVFMLGLSLSLCINDVYMYMVTGERGEPHNINIVENMLSAGLTITAIAGITGFIFLVISAMCVGKRSEEGIYMNWFDRICTELKLILAGGLSYVFVLVIDGLRNFSMNGSIGLRLLYRAGIDPVEFLEYTYGTSERGGIFSETFVTITCFAAFFLIAATCVAIFLSLVKHLKNHSFLRSLVLVDGLYRLADSVKKSEKTEIVVMATLIGGIVISGTGIGSLLVLVVTIMTVPKLLKQYREIKTGVKEVKEGNTSWKIPVMSQTDLGRLASDINDISTAIEIAVENELKHQKMKTDLISNVSHDLKTPLTSMISYVDLLKREGPSSENAGEYIRILDEKTRRLKSLTENLFEAAKASSGELPVNLMEIEMSALVNQAVAELEEILDKNNLEIIRTIPEEDTTVIADGQLLWRVIENLLTNVSKYAVHGSRVYIDLSADDGKTMLEIKNMSADQLNITVEELMERFTRGDESRNTEGSGLGLGIARDLTELMGGTFEISIDGDLFKAKVTLPSGE